MDNRVYIWSIEGYAYGLQFLCKMTIWYPEEDGLWGYGGVAHGYPNCYQVYVTPCSVQGQTDHPIVELQS